VNRVASALDETLSLHRPPLTSRPGMDPRFTLETIERFGKDVIPQIKRRTPECRCPKHYCGPFHTFQPFNRCAPF
jgi:hypothetical protein